MDNFCSYSESLLLMTIVSNNLSMSLEIKVIHVFLWKWSEMGINYNIM